MKPMNAYEIICNKYKSKPFVQLCKDFGDAYGFFLTENEDDRFVGSSMLCVDKRTGKTFDYNLMDPMYDYRSAEVVPFNSNP